MSESTEASERSVGTDAHARPGPIQTLVRRAAVVVAAGGVVALGVAAGLLLGGVAVAWLDDGDPAYSASRHSATGSQIVAATPSPPMRGRRAVGAAPASPDIEVAAREPVVEAAVEKAERLFAAPAGNDSRPMIAVVIDDMGVARALSRRATELPGPLTLAFLPYASDLAAQAEAARRAGHELLLHLPMEPDDDAEDPGPRALLTGLDDDELRRRLEWNLDRLDTYVGVSNHMGSRFTRDAKAMAIVLEEVKRRGLIFLDSRTTAETVGESMARELGIPAASRDVFIDDDPDPNAILAELNAIEELARKRGYAVAIGHPRPETLTALAAWLPALADGGFTLAPISAVVARSRNLAAAPPDADGN